MIPTNEKTARAETDGFSKTSIQPSGEGCYRLASAKSVSAITHHSNDIQNLPSYRVRSKGVVHHSTGRAREHRRNQR